MAESKLWEALDYLRDHGWCKDRLELPDGRVCARGALSAVWRTERQYFGWNEADDSRIEAVARELFPERMVHKFHDPVPAFNNHPDTTFEDVELVFEKAAIRADELL